jgi:hypothetical protein
VSFSYIEKVNSYREHFTKQEVPKNSFFNKEYNSEAPINGYQVLSKYLKGGFPWDKVIQQILDTYKDTYSLQFYIKVDLRAFLSTLTYKEWIVKQNQVPVTYTQVFVEQKIVTYKRSGPCIHYYHDYVSQENFGTTSRITRILKIHTTLLIQIGVKIL